MKTILEERAIRLRLDWAAAVLTFTWQERGGPAVNQPGSSGFGSRILGTFAKNFCRNVEARFEPGGLRSSEKSKKPNSEIKFIHPDGSAWVAAGGAGYC